MYIHILWILNCSFLYSGTVNEQILQKDLYVKELLYHSERLFLVSIIILDGKMTFSRLSEKNIKDYELCKSMRACLNMTDYMKEKVSWKGISFIIKTIACIR